MYYKLENRTHQKNWKPLHTTIQACQRAADQNWNETMKSIWSHTNACCRAAHHIIQQFTFEHDLRAASFQDFIVLCRRSTLSVEQWNHICIISRNNIYAPHHKHHFHHPYIMPLLVKKELYLIHCFWYDCSPFSIFDAVYRISINQSIIIIAFSTLHPFLCMLCLREVHACSCSN